MIRGVLVLLGFAARLHVLHRVGRDRSCRIDARLRHAFFTFVVLRARVALAENFDCDTGFKRVASKQSRYADILNPFFEGCLVEANPEWDIRPPVVVQVFQVPRFFAVANFGGDVTGVKS